MAENRNVRDVAVAVPYDAESDRFLVLKRAATKEPFPGKWEFPAGYVEDPEQPRDAALRELLEEAGLLGTIIRTGDPHTVTVDDTAFRVHPFLVHVTGTSVERSSEHTDARWLDRSELPGLDAVDGFMQDLAAIGVEP